jgi:hypothetical protein
MKTAILVSLLASAAAFAPSKQTVKTSSALNSNPAFANELGVQEPVSEKPHLISIPVVVMILSPLMHALICSTLSLSFLPFDSLLQQLGFYDPAGMLNNASEARFNRLREVELKHGRISMLAVVGYLVTEAGIRLPGDLTLSGVKFADIPAGFAALSAIPKEGVGQIIGFIFFLEMIMRDITGTGEHIGDFRNGAIDFGWDSFDEATKLKKRAIELNQGRAAQMGILGLMVHEQLGTLDYIIPGLN